MAFLIGDLKQFLLFLERIRLITKVPEKQEIVNFILSENQWLDNGNYVLFSICNQFYIDFIKWDTLYNLIKSWGYPEVKVIYG